TETYTESTEYGPITMVFNQLADMAVDVSDQTSAQLQENIDRLLATIARNVETISSDAMLEVSNVIDETNAVIMANPNCMPAWHLQEFTANVSQQLRMCSIDAGRLIEAARADGQQALVTLQGLVQQMAQLPALCQGQEAMGSVALAPLGIELSGGGSNNCFMDGIAQINQGIAQAMHSASLLLERTRQLSRQQVSRQQACSAAVVRQVTAYLSEQRENCT
ncbi:hypothetical protein KR222_001341, partial [Zaprionus bogoriensis]